MDLRYIRIDPMCCRVSTNTNTNTNANRNLIMSSKDTWKETLAGIAIDKLAIDVFERIGDDDLELHTLTLRSLRRALVAAYRAGIAGGLQHLRLPSSEGDERLAMSPGCGGAVTRGAYRLGAKVMSRVTQYGLDAGRVYSIQELRQVLTIRGPVTTVTVQIGQRLVEVHNPAQLLVLAHIEARGVKGPHGQAWRARFADADELSTWCQLYDARVQHQRYVEAEDVDNEG